MDARWCAGCWTILSNGTVIVMHHRIGRCCATSRAAREEPSVPFVGRKSCTGSGIMLQSLLLRLPPLQERVANAVTFPTCQRADHNSDPVGNGDGGPESGATAPIFGAHGANREADLARVGEAYAAREVVARLVGHHAAPERVGHAIERGEEGGVVEGVVLNSKKSF